jgi:hypothetical protein
VAWRAKKSSEQWHLEELNFFNDSCVITNFYNDIHVKASYYLGWAYTRRKWCIVAVYVQKWNDNVRDSGVFCATATVLLSTTSFICIYICRYMYG